MKLMFYNYSWIYQTYQN